MAYTVAVIAGAIHNREIFMAKLGGTVEADIEAIDDPELVVAQIDARNNPGEDVTLRLYVEPAPTLGTDAAEVWLRCKAGKLIIYHFPRPIIFGSGATGAISAICVKEQGGFTGNTSPSGQVDILLGLID